MDNLKKATLFDKWNFLYVCILIFLVCSLIKYEQAGSCIKMFVSIIIKMVPIFILIFVLMAIINLYLKPEKIQKYIGKESGIKKWGFAILSGIISTGPVYMYYPILKDLRKQGVGNSLIATALYSKAIKPALIPLTIYYFGIAFTIVFNFYLIIAAILQGIIIGRLFKK